MKKYVVHFIWSSTNNFLVNSTVMETSSLAKVTTVWLLTLVASTQAVPYNCSTQYQAAMQLVLDLREMCSEAIYEDCCEVS